LELYPFKGNSVLGREIRSLITLGMGVCFYFVAALLPKSEPRLRSSLRWLYFGAFLLLIWSTVQIFRLPYSFNPPALEMARIHRFISIQDLFRDRVTGMAYEPSWLADQLVVLYIPLWLGSVIKGYSVFKFGWKRISAETIFLIWGISVLFFTYSRIGLLAFIASVTVLLIAGSWRYVDELAKNQSNQSRWSHWQLKGIYWAAIILFLFVAVGAIIVLAAQTNERFRDILSINLGSIFGSERLPVIYNLANQLEYAERLMYWINAFLIFSTYPFLGIGLGNAGFLFRENVPAFGYYLPEVLHILGPEMVTIANPKSLWMRLIGETGFIGFSVFVIWLLILAFGAIKLSKDKGLFAAIGLAGGIALTAQLFEGFSLDTFALPQLWIMLGLLTGAIMNMPDRAPKAGKP
jgi:hypothetical protein